VKFYNGIFIKRRVSGKYCPVCGRKMKKYRRTRRLELYKCSCGVLIDKIHTQSKTVKTPHSRPPVVVPVH